MNNFVGEYRDTSRNGVGKAKMRDYDDRMKALRRQIELATQQLRELEEERDAYERQRQLRQRYLSSREILELLAKRGRREGSLSTIKRWADEGYLGDMLEERVHFPLLATTQGKKRFLYPKREVCLFLYQKGLLQPKYDILDRVQREGNQVQGIVTSVELRDDRFFYTIQEEGTQEILTGVPEEELLDAE
jgi:hypothetical protein